MPTTYSEFLDRFREHITEVADFEGDDEQTSMTVIIDSLNEAGLKDVLDQYDAIRNQQQVQSGGVAATNDVKKTKKSAVSSKSDETDGTKPVSGRASAKAAAAPAAAAAGAKPKRVTGYNLYVQDQVKNGNCTMKDAADGWKKISDSDKALYLERATKENESRAQACASAASAIAD